MAEKSFLDQFASTNQACSDMDFAGGGWLPEDGIYTVRLTKTKCKEFTNKGDGVTKLRYAVSFAIVDGRLEGRGFQDVMFITPGATELDQSLRQLCFLATCLAGREIKKADEAYSLIEDAAKKGEVLNVEIFRREGVDKMGNPKIWENIRYHDTVATEEVPAEA
jgi:hypothetical protein